jgi:hypothetical protein
VFLYAVLAFTATPEQVFSIPHSRFHTEKRDESGEFCVNYTEAVGCAFISFLFRGILYLIYYAQTAQIERLRLKT